jgi:hypothetical protein
VTEISILSHQFKTASELSERLNRAVLAIKKIRLGLPGARAESTQFSEHRDILLQAIGDLLAQLEPLTGIASATQAEAAARFPASLVSQIKHNRRGYMGLYLVELERAKENLGHGVHALADDDIRLCDELAAAAGDRAAAIFRRLMRR